MAPEKAACNLINCLQWCHSMAWLHCGKCRHQILKRNPLSTICHFYSTHSSSLSKHGVFITHNATELVSDFTGGDLSDYVQLPLEPQNASYNFVHICSRTPEDLLSETKQLRHQNKMLPFNVSPNHRYVQIFACYMYHLAFLQYISRSHYMYMRWLC